MLHVSTHARHVLTGLALALLALVLTLFPNAVRSQTETLSLNVGADTALTFAHASLPGAIGIDYHFSLEIEPAYPGPGWQPLIVVFEWGPAATGPWSAGLELGTPVPGGMTWYFATGIFHEPVDAPFVRLHFYAGGPMYVTGSFTHTSVVPEPGPAGLWLLGLALLGWRHRQPGGVALRERPRRARRLPAP